MCGCLLPLGVAELLPAHSVEVLDQLFVRAGLNIDEQLVQNNLRPNVLLHIKDGFRRGRFRRQAPFPLLPPYAGKKPMDPKWVRPPQSGLDPTAGKPPPQQWDQRLL